MTDEEWQRVLDAQPERAKALRALAVPGDPLATAEAQVDHLLGEDTAARAVVLEELDRRFGLGMSEVDALRSVLSDLHNGRWRP